MEKKTNVGRLTRPNFKTKSHRGHDSVGHTGEWDGMGSPDVIAHIYNQVIFDEAARRLSGERTGFTTDGVGPTVRPHTEE